MKFNLSISLALISSVHAIAGIAYRNSLEKRNDGIAFTYDGLSMFNLPANLPEEDRYTITTSVNFDGCIHQCVNHGSGGQRTKECATTNEIAEGISKSVHNSKTAECVRTNMQGDLKACCTTGCKKIYRKH